ncbi:MAG: PilZ domain-containing protein [Sphingosinicella sp.]|nr:PilZ domain-containing protein [Sphingosinicella sp.]
MTDPGRSQGASADAPVFRIPRRPVNLSAKLISARRNNEVQILNLSNRGALLRGGRGLAVGEKVIIHRGEFDLPAEVRWVRGARFGIAFEAPLRSVGMAAFGQARPEDRRDTRGLLRLFYPR